MATDTTIPEEIINVLEWYGEKAASIGLRISDSSAGEYLLAIMTELGLDGGRRAGEILDGLRSQSQPIPAKKKVLKAESMPEFDESIENMSQESKDRVDKLLEEMESTPAQDEQDWLSLIELAHLRGYQDSKKSGNAKFNVTESLNNFKMEHGLGGIA